MRLQRRSTPIGGLELVSLPVRSAALLGLSGERRRAHGSLRVLPRPGASRRRRARPQDSTAPRLGSLHAPPTLLPVAPARRLGGLPQPSLVALSAARHTFARRRRTQRHTVWSQGDSARLAPRLASRRRSLVLALAPRHEGCRNWARLAVPEPLRMQTVGRKSTQLAALRR